MQKLQQPVTREYVYIKLPPRPPSPTLSGLAMGNHSLSQLGLVQLHSVDPMFRFSTLPPERLSETLAEALQKFVRLFPTLL
jgi:hypothetical protein